jgi:phosphohistidine phosphatase
MTDLYILRHGIAVEPGTPGIPDDQRPLTAKGEKRMRQVARGLRLLGLKVERIVTSPLPRARATAEIVADALDAPERLEVSSVLQAGAAATTIERWLRERSEKQLMIVGHNPTLSDLISLLVLGATERPICDLKKGGIAALKRTAVATDQYDVAWIAPPRLFRSLSGAEEGPDKQRRR